MLEAMAAAKPVVATDVSSHASILDGGRCGLLVRPNDPSALATAMLKLVADPDRAVAMGAAGRARARERYSLERMAREYEALYVRLYRGRGSGRPGAGPAVTG
jgi:glycosyltransferase involved in cell wall biosynthesis